MRYPVRSYWVYILASKPRGTLYIGVTHGIIFRVEQHRAGKASAFTRKYKVHMLVRYQEFADVREAIQREKTMKEWPRAWKVNLIERTNPHWEDLYPSLPGVKACVDLRCHAGACTRHPASHLLRSALLDGSRAQAPQ
jgi:putative endonuclease